jgi:hypothetical protein
MKNLRKENRDLLDLMAAISNDLIMRGTKDKHGNMVINLSYGLWSRLNETLNKPVESIGLPDQHGKLPKHHKQWFHQLQKASSAGDLALIACLDAKTMEPRSVLALVGHEDGAFLVTPIGHLCTEANPYEAYIPPRTEQEIER